jgi:hypothetical protein
VLCLSADDLPPLASFDSVTWPSLSTIVVPSENATDLRGLRSASYCSGQTHIYHKLAGRKRRAKFCGWRWMSSAQCISIVDAGREVTYSVSHDCGYARFRCC